MESSITGTGTAAPTHWVLLQVVPAQDTGLQPPEHSEAVKATSEFTAEAHVILETKCQLLNSPLIWSLLCPLT